MHVEQRRPVRQQLDAVVVDDRLVVRGQDQLGHAALGRHGIHAAAPDREEDAIVGAPGPVEHALGFGNAADRLGLPSSVGADLPQALVVTEAQGRTVRRPEDRDTFQLGRFQRARLQLTQVTHHQLSVVDVGDAAAVG